MKPLIVVYYHRILPFKGYDLDLDTFAWHLDFYKKYFHVVDPEELLAMQERIDTKRASVLITFDDGFFDNYVFAYPMLKKHGLKALIFVPTSKITDGEKRATLEDYWQGKVTFEQLHKPHREEKALADSLNGVLDEFVRWDELREMRESGTFAIGSHGHMHVKIFTSDKVIGVYGLSSVHWSYPYAIGKKPQAGMPVFQMQSSLAGRRFIVSDEFIDYSLRIYNSSADRSLSELVDMLDRYPNKGKYEESFCKRILDELEISIKLIEENIGIKPVFLSWPWGEYSSTGKQLAKRAGFEFCFNTKKGAFLGGSLCSIGRIKAPANRGAFVRKMLLNRYTFAAKLYKWAHEK